MSTTSTTETLLKYALLALLAIGLWPVVGHGAVPSKFAWNTGLDYGVLVDGRDGRHYKTVEIDQQEWMAENLRYASDSSWCYDRDTVNCNLYGRLYPGVDADKVCPKGWHLPSASEWKALIRYVGGKNVMTKLIATEGWSMTPRALSISRFTNYFTPIPKKLIKADSAKLGEAVQAGPQKPEDRRITDRYGFRILPAGIHSTPGGAGEQAYVQMDLSKMTRTKGGEFGLLGSYTFFWAATPFDTSFTWRDDDRLGVSVMYPFESTNTFGFSVRCIDKVGR